MKVGDKVAFRDEFGRLRSGWIVALNERTVGINTRNGYGTYIRSRSEVYVQANS